MERSTRQSNAEGLRHMSEHISNHVKIDKPSKRKALSKKLRFEVFKRDLFVCQYCGNSPPNVVLEVDHIQPVALGGTDTHDNLITSCFACNRGKSDNLITEVMPPLGMAEKARLLRESEAQILAYRDAVMAKEERIESDCWFIVDMLFSKDTVRRDWFRSIRKFVEDMPLDWVIDAADRSRSRLPYSEPQRFKYFGRN